MRLEELKVYNQAMEIGEEIWGIVVKWDYFAKDTMGKQLVRAIDSVAANLSEGFGRYHYRESKNFAYYSRGSLYETKTWLTKAKNRKYINDEEFKKFANTIDTIGKMLNNYIKSIGRSSTTNNH
ncbi:four helix bundle protein [candidate division KSB1 bacterium]|nr:four helix bundle protein [candidate division KSB1 bacterium]MBL7095472.1 four helix bundle protein [candidate division KSB1 bacterium]